MAAGGLATFVFSVSDTTASSGQVIPVTARCTGAGSSQVNGANQFTLSTQAALPPESRAKVLSSLQTINDSKRDLERELGKDPSNALLQELLVNTYQDEMRVLSAVHEAGGASGGI